MSATKSTEYTKAPVPREKHTHKSTLVSIMNPHEHFVVIKNETESTAEELLLLPNTTDIYHKNPIDTSDMLEVDSREFKITVEELKVPFLNNSNCENVDDNREKMLKDVEQGEISGVVLQAVKKEKLELYKEDSGESIDKRKAKCDDINSEKCVDEETVDMIDRKIKVECMNLEEANEGIRCTEAIDKITEIGEIEEQKLKIEPKQEIADYCITNYYNPDLNLNNVEEGIDGPHISIVCNAAFRTSSSLESHAHTHIDPQLLQQDQKCAFFCQFCPKRFPRKTALTQHLRTHSNDRPHTCQFCGKQFVNKNGLQYHETIHTKDRPFTCQHCDKSFVLKHHLVEHERVHTLERPYECKTCGKRFLRKYHLTQHHSVHATERSFPCQFCGLCFKQKRVRDRHEKTHSAQVSHGCSVCDKRFSENSMPGSRAGIHTCNRPYACTFCNKGFFDRNKLLLHERVHTNDRPFPCTVCSKRFTQRSYLLDHMRIHGSVRPHVCEICGKGFIQIATLVGHRRTHTGNHPFECRLCKKGFDGREALEEHQKDHAHSNPFPCDTCGKRFKLKQVLTRHQLLLHSDKELIKVVQRDFACEMCNKKFTSKTWLEKHVKKVHKKDGVPNASFDSNIQEDAARQEPVT